MVYVTVGGRASERERERERERKRVRETIFGDYLAPAIRTRVDAVASPDALEGSIFVPAGRRRDAPSARRRRVTARSECASTERHSTKGVNCHACFPLLLSVVPLLLSVFLNCRREGSSPCSTPRLGANREEE